MGRDIGDNGARRESIVITQAKVGLGAETDEGILPQRYVYPDGAHDAETLMAAPDGRLLIVTKGFLGGTLFATPRPEDLGFDEVRTLEQLSSPNAMLPMRPTARSCLTGSTSWCAATPRPRSTPGRA